MDNTPVAEKDASIDPREADRYDFADIQDRWLPVWDELAPFRSGDPADQRPNGMNWHHFDQGTRLISGPRNMSLTCSPTRPGICTWAMQRHMQ